MSNFSRFVDERIENSLTSLTPSEEVIDELEPLSFVDWVKYNKENVPDTNVYISRYNSYLQNWFIGKNLTQEASEVTIQKLYVGLINEIVLNYTTPDEKRFLKNIDTNNPRDLVTVVPFFAQKIKNICLYYSTLREDIKFSAIQSNLNGSNFGIEKLIYNSLVKTLEADDIVEYINTLNLSLSSIRDNAQIKVEDIYDVYPNYFDVSSTKSASAYNSISDVRSQTFSLNQYDIDPYLFLDLNQSILRAILAYPFYLIELGSNLTIDPKVDSTQLTFLKDSNYTTLINTESIDELNLLNRAQAITKYMGTDFYYLQTNSVGTPALTGLLFKADSAFANYLNKRYPSVAAVPSTEFLRTAKEQGLFFKPDKIGFLNFSNFKFIPFVKENLEPNTLYYFPDPYKLGNISSLTKEEFNSPFEFFEDNTANTTSFANQFDYGSARTEPWLQTFRSYQSREQTLDKGIFGVSRYVDSQGFFTGKIKELWSNEDVYPLVPANKFPIDERQETLLSLFKTLIQYKSDIYGNDYGLYKDIEPDKVTNLLQSTPLPSVSECLALNGHLFYDPISGYDFNYNIVNTQLNYSGVTLKTSTTTSGPAVSSNGNWSLSSIDWSIVSYRFLPEIFCEDYINIVYKCNIKDGSTFVIPPSTFLPDFPSDSPAYNPNSSGLYYDELIDGGVSHLNPPTYRANFTYQGDFNFTPPLTAIQDFDGNLFVVANSAEPCGSLFEPEPLYTEQSFFLDYHIPLRETEVDTEMKGILEKRTIYESSKIDYGQLYFRNGSSTVIAPISAALSASFIKYPSEIINEINTKLINFDVFYDIITFETEHYVIFDSIRFNLGADKITQGSGRQVYLTKDQNMPFDRVSNVWFNEADKNLIICRMTLLPENSATNYKVVYPKIYLFDLKTEAFNQIYPTKKDSSLTFNDLRIFSLIDKSINLEITEIDSPILSYNDDINLYKLSYIGRDTSNCPYIFIIEFNYITGVVKIKSVTVYKPNNDVAHQNFADYNSLDTFDTNTILGNNVGAVVACGDSKAFTWGSEYIIDGVPLFTFNNESIQTEDGDYFMYSS
jgi:hypothetical protein